MNIYNKKGFTLVELLAVLVVLGIVVSISIYTITSIINKTKEKGYQVTLNEIKNTANDYLIEERGKILFANNGDGTEYQCITITQLIQSGYLKNDITKSLIAKNTTVNMNDIVIITRNQSSKVVDIIDYYRFDNTEIQSKCEVAATLINNNNNNGNDNNNDNNNNNSGNDNNINPVPISQSDFDYTGGPDSWEFVAEDNNNWHIRFLTSGTLTVSKNMELEVFLVGGGASGGSGQRSDYAGGGGGGSGGAISTGTVTLNPTTYRITIGSGGTFWNDGTETTGFGLIAAGGGKGGNSAPNYYNGNSGGLGGTVANGASGGRGVSISKYSTYTSSELGTDGTAAFEDGDTYGIYGGGGGGGSSVTSGLINGYYSLNSTSRNSGINASGGAGGGGGGGGRDSDGSNGIVNTGGGGGGGGAGAVGGTGGSGIIIIRNAR